MSAIHAPIQDRTMPPRAHQPRYEGLKLIVSVLTLATLLIAVSQYFTTKGQRDQELTEVRQAFKEFAAETSSTLKTMSNLLSELAKQNALLGQKINSLEDWRRWEKQGGKSGPTP